MKLIINHATVLLLLAVSVCTYGQPRGQTDGINAGYKASGMQAQTWASRFEVEGREVFDFRNEIITSLGLETGEQVADVGAGSGLFTPLLANTVGRSGTVYAVDIIPQFIEFIENKVEEAGLTQVETVLSSETSIELPTNSVDMVFTSDAYHHFVYYEDMLASIMSALRRGGELIIIEFDIDKAPNMATHVGGTKEEFTRQVTTAGFELVEDFTLPAMETTFMRRFRKP